MKKSESLYDQGSDVFFTKDKNLLVQHLPCFSKLTELPL